MATGLPLAASGALFAWKLSRKTHDEPQTNKAKKKIKDKRGETLEQVRRLIKCLSIESCFSLQDMNNAYRSETYVVSSPLSPQSPL